MPFLLNQEEIRMKMELTDEKRKGYVVCALMILVSCLYLVYLGYSLYRMGHA